MAPPSVKSRAVNINDDDMSTSAYVAVPPTPQPFGSGDDASMVATDKTKKSSKKKPTRAEQYALQPPHAERANPLESASFLSIVSTHWLQPLISLGASKALEKQDLWRVCARDTCDALETRFQYWYTGDGATRATAMTPAWFSRFGVALLLTFRRDLSVVFLNYLIYLTAMVLQPFLTQAILNYLNGRDNVFHVTNGYVLVALMAGISLVGVTCLNYGVFLLSRMGANMRSVVMNAVYKKALTLSSAARQSYTTGEIMTLMSVDTERIFSANLSMPWLVIAPLAFLLTSVLIAAVFDVVAALFGVLLIVTIIMTSIKLAHTIGRVQGALLRVVEERVKVTSEALQGIRVMKFYAWEASLAARVERIRAVEVAFFRKFHFLSIVNSTLLFLTPLLLGALVLGIYIWRKGTMTVTDAFTLIAMVNITRLAVNLFPMAIASGSQARIALRRIDKYMESPELETESLAIEHEHESENENDDRRGTILVRNATFQWGDAPAAATTDDASTAVAVGHAVPDVVVVGVDNSDKVVDATIANNGSGDDTSSDTQQGATSGFSLEGVNLEIEAGSLVMIVGTVGAGKTSLLSALLGEMARTAGACDVRGELSFVSQEAWIRNSTVKDNILFEAPFDSARYEQVLEATQLALDLHALPDGDQTEIGERGINLSGGQKARVAIARAMYRLEYDILVLDDPLSAVDPHVAHAIFDRCIVGLAQHKTRLLVLNSHYDLLARADKILVVEHGRVVGDGSFRDIVAQFPDLDVRKRELESLERDVIDEHERREVEDRMSHAAAHAAAVANISGDSSDADASVARTSLVTAATSVVAVAANEKPPVKPSSAKLVQDEDRVKGRVSGNTYQTYFEETGFNGWLVVAVLVTIYSAAQGLKITADYWQGYWAKQMPRKGVDPTYSQHFYMSWYFTFIATCTVLTFVRGFMMIEACMRTARNIHNELFRRVLRAPVNRYFDVTPVGRILNRFSNDLDQVDANLPQQYQGLVESLASFFGSLVVCAFASMWIAVSYIPMLVVFVVTGLYFKRTSREVKRLEGITRTPVYNLFGETLNGLATIRAFKMQQSFERINKRVVDENASFYFHFWATGRWLAVRLDWLSVVIILVVSLYVVASKDTIAPIVAGLSITYSLQLTSMVQWCVRAMDMTDNAMTSVERLLAFRDVPTERDDGTPVNTAAWPSAGAIVFDRLCLKYRPELPLVLRGVEMEIRGGEKVGICGRTGAGKSSLMIALFRICEFESGTVRIDGVDIATLPLRDLRRALAIIPQDPVLYSGSLRENLDPFSEYADDAIWRVLAQVHLADAVGKWGAGLEFVVSERGDNLSVGQRQLLCIGRALLKDSKIVVLDEATANVDTATDSLIQTTIQQTFVDKTVLIIAHRINTILHCNKIAVMDAGQVAEFGAPTELLARSDSIFASLAKRSTTPHDEN